MCATRLLDIALHLPIRANVANIANIANVSVSELNSERRRHDHGRPPLADREGEKDKKKTPIQKGWPETLAPSDAQAVDVAFSRSPFDFAIAISLIRLARGG